MVKEVRTNSYPLHNLDSGKYKSIKSLQFFRGKGFTLIPIK